MGIHIFVVLVLAPFGLMVSVLALAASTVALLLFVLLCLAYRTFWFGTMEGRVYLRAIDVERRKEKIKKKELLRRTALSRRSDRQIVGELISIIRKEMDQRKNEIMINNSVLARIRLQDCMRTLDFDAAMEIYQVLTQTQADSINQRLERQLGLNPKV